MCIQDTQIENGAEIQERLHFLGPLGGEVRAPGYLKRENEQASPPFPLGWLKCTSVSLS